MKLNLLSKQIFLDFIFFGFTWNPNQLICGPFNFNCQGKMSDVLSENNSTEASETSFETVSDASPFTVPSDHLESIESSEESSEDLSVLNSFLSSGIDVDYFEGGDVEERPLVLHVHQK